MANVEIDNSTARRFDHPGAPCPVCECHTKNCSTTADELFRCRGEAADPGRWRVVRKSGDWTFFREGARPQKSRGRAATPSRNSAPAGGGSGGQVSPRSAPPDFAAQMAAQSAMFVRQAAKRPEIAAELSAQLGGVPAEALARFTIGLDGVRIIKNTFTFAEVDGSGRVVGIVARLPDGSKRALPGSSRGLTIAHDWRELSGDVIFIVEGASCTIAMRAAGLRVIGRYSADGGADLLALMLGDLPPETRIVVVGERDLKPDNRWPGLDGARVVARQLAARLGREVAVNLTPESFKDSRAFLTAPDLEGVDWGERGARFVAGLVPDANDAIASPVGGEGGPSAAPAGAAGGCPNDGATDPHRLAEVARAAYVDAHGHPTIVNWRNEFWLWEGGRYRPLPGDEVRAVITFACRADFVRINLAAMAAFDSNSGESPPVTNKVTTALVGNVLNALASVTRIGDAVDPPCWLAGGGPDPADLVAARNGIVDLNLFAAGDENCLLPATARFFALIASPWDFAIDAPEPTAVFEFHRATHPGDPESVAAIQEVAGLGNNPATKFHVIPGFLGKPGSGKGSELRFLAWLLGDGSVAATSMPALGERFGAQKLLGKSLIVIGDDRSEGVGNNSALAIERLLGISGEDTIDVDRKGLPPVSARLRAIIVIASNELLKVRDNSLAIMRRIRIIPFKESFVGREDPDVEKRMQANGPGALLWALAGLCRLRARGRFLQPKSGLPAVEQMGENLSPAKRYVRERCRVGDGLTVRCEALFRDWVDWCNANNHKPVGSSSSFASALPSAVKGFGRRKLGCRGDRHWCYVGLDIAPFVGADDDEDGPDSNKCQTDTQADTGPIPAIDPYLWPVGPAAKRLQSQRAGKATHGVTAIGGGGGGGSGGGDAAISPLGAAPCPPASNGVSPPVDTEALENVANSPPCPRVRLIPEIEAVSGEVLGDDLAACSAQGAHIRRTTLTPGGHGEIGPGLSDAGTDNDPSTPPLEPAKPRRIYRNSDHLSRPSVTPDGGAA